MQFSSIHFEALKGSSLAANQKITKIQVIEGEFLFVQPVLNLLNSKMSFVDTSGKYLDDGSTVEFDSQYQLMSRFYRQHMCDPPTMTLTDNYILSFDFKLLLDIFSQQQITISRVLNKNGANNDFSRYPIILYYTDVKKITYGFTSCDATDWSQQQYITHNSLIEVGKTYRLSVQRSGTTITLGVDGVQETMVLNNVDQVCQDNREVELKFFMNDQTDAGFSDPWIITNVVGDWAEVSNAVYENN